MALLFLAGCAWSGHPPRPYATWRVTSDTQRLGCATVSAWVSRSGRDGAGVTLELRGTSDQACAVAIRRTFLQVGDRVVPGDRLPPAVTVTRLSAVRAYVAYPFVLTDQMQGATLVVDDAQLAMELAK
jgi:hypothetical protein